ncbi:hypothetical protein KEM55_002522 [Ascosphaera atra]|nr:hypothetical protein KEM55_002522 [Ascosphaera atra]
MEAMVYQDSPLASYLEAEGTASSHGDDVLTTTAIPHRDTDDSDARSDGDSRTDDDDERSDREKVDFAPSNNVALDKQIRDHLPQPLALQPFPFLRYPSLAAILDAFRSLLTVSLSEADNKRFLEQLGYKIVASQLLNEQSPPSYATASSILANAPTQHEVSESSSHSLVAAGLSAKGALLAPAVSFCLVYLVNWLLLASSSTETETETPSSTGTRGRRRSSVTTISLTTRETTYHPHPSPSPSTAQATAGYI